MPHPTDPKQSPNTKEAPLVTGVFPQFALLERLTEALKSNPAVAAIWLGGSFGRGAGDQLSDLDIRVQLRSGLDSELTRLEFPVGAGIPKVVHLVKISLGDKGLLQHSILESGDVVDLEVLTADYPIGTEHRRIIWCPDPQLQLELQNFKEGHAATRRDPVIPANVRETICSALLVNLKEARVIHRGLLAVATFGFQHERATLMRLWFIDSTGFDCGDLERQNITSSTPAIREIACHRGDQIMELLGMPLRTSAEQYHATQVICAEVKTVGERLAKRYNFDFPTALYDANRAVWSRFNKLNPQLDSGSSRALG